MNSQTKTKERLTIPFFDPDSQSNIVVTVCDIMGGQPCPKEFTNTLSNTNLLSDAERDLVMEIRYKYRNVTTNSGPLGTVLANLYRTNSVYMNRTNQSWVARFNYTNSDAQEEIWFGFGISAKFWDKMGDGYSVGMGDVVGGSMLRITQTKNGVADGLQTDFLNDRLESYMHYSNGMAIGKFFMWKPLIPTNNLLIEADFKQPYDIQKHTVQMRW